jgi:hypothetical protein
MSISDLEGTPRYATWAWVNQLSNVNKETGSIMRLAGHLCGSRCQEVIPRRPQPICSHNTSQVLDGDFRFVSELHKLGFNRVQVNATKANAVDVDPAQLSTYAQQLRASIESVPEVEWIFQLNEETRPLWNLISADEIPSNMSVLFDASCGLGVVATTFTPPLTNPDVLCGYAGGFAPNNIAALLDLLIDAAGGKPVWVDMESSLRVAVSDKHVLDKDVFSIDKCFACIKVGVMFGMPVARFSVMEI